jgi:nucleoside-diphosphate-sugar epimerase
MESGLPYSIYRLSTIISHSDGTVTQFNYAHQLMKLLARKIMPVMPGAPDRLLDLICSDWAAHALRRFFFDEFQPGRIWNLCASPEHSLTVAELIELSGGGAPRFISLAEWEELGRTTPDRLLRELIRVLSFTLPHFALDQRFATSHGLALPDLRPLIPGIAAQSRARTESRVRTP